MNDQRFRPDLAAQLRARKEGFDERAYLFVLAAIEYLQTRLPERRHITGQELAHGCREFALEQYGLLARTVLEHWGIRGTEDFGRIVFALVDIGLLVTQPHDREEDFHGVYSFTEAFDASYVWRQIREV